MLDEVLQGIRKIIRKPSSSHPKNIHRQQIQRESTLLYRMDGWMDG